MAGDRTIAGGGRGGLLSFSASMLPSLVLHLRYKGIMDSARCMGTLAFEEITVPEDVAPASTAIVLHGLLGSGRNWRTFTRKLASSLTNSSFPAGAPFLLFFNVFYFLFHRFIHLNVQSNDPTI